VVGPLKDDENQLVSDNEVMCEILNSYFGSVFTSENVSKKIYLIKLKLDRILCHLN